MLRCTMIGLLTLLPALQSLAEPVLLFNSHTAPAQARVTLHPAQLGLAGVSADKITLRVAGKEIPSQAEDADGDGKITDKDVVYASLDVPPGNTWIKGVKGKPTTPERLISAERKGNVISAGWVYLNARTGQLVRCRLQGKTTRKVSLDLGTPDGKWSKLKGRLRLQNLPLRTRLDFVSQGKHPVQISVRVYPQGQCEMITSFPKGPSKWSKNRHVAARPYLSQAMYFKTPCDKKDRYNFMTRTGAWYSSKQGGEPYGRVYISFAGITQPGAGGVGLFFPDEEGINSQFSPGSVKLLYSKDGKDWNPVALQSSTTGRHQLWLVRYEQGKSPKRASKALAELYRPVKVWDGVALRRMLEERFAALSRIKDSAPKAIASARAALKADNLPAAAKALEKARAKILANLQTRFKTLESIKPAGPALTAALGEARVYLAGQKKDRHRPRRYIQKYSPSTPGVYVDRLTRADRRLVGAADALQRAQHLAQPEKLAQARSLMQGEGEPFRIGFGDYGGFLRNKNLELKWGFDYFKPLIDVGIQHFHSQSVVLYAHQDGPDDKLQRMEGWHGLLDAFDKTPGASMVLQIHPWVKHGPTAWQKRAFADSMFEMEHEQASDDGKIHRWKTRSVVWQNPEFVEHISSFQKWYAEGCRKVVRELQRHSSIIGWAANNEPSSLVDRELKQGKFSREMFHTYLRDKYKKIENLNAAWGSKYASFKAVPLEASKRRDLKPFEKKLDGTWKFQIDPKNVGVDKGWAKAGFDDIAWRTIKVPSHWENEFPDLAKYDGLAWYRQKVRVPKSWAGKAIRLQCNGIDDDADIYVNGVRALANRGWNNPIDVDISSLLHMGKTNTIAIRVNDTFRIGGVYHPVTLAAKTSGDLPALFAQPQRQLDREMFAQANVAGYCAYNTRAVHEADPKRRPAVIKEWCLKTPPEGPQHQLDSFLAARAHFGVAACDMYKGGYMWYPMAIDMMRSANPGKPIWLTETLYFHPGFMIPETLEQTTWSMAVRGLRSVYFWGMDRRAHPGDGVANDFTMAAAVMQKRFDAISPVLAGRRNTQVAIYLPRDSQFLCDRLKIDAAWEKLGWMLFDLNVPYDFIDDTKIAAGRLGNYKLLLVTPSPYLPPATAKAIRTYVQDGGSVVMNAASAVHGYQGQEHKLRPGYGLTDVFGAEVQPSIPTPAKQIQRTAAFKGLGVGPGVRDNSIPFSHTITPTTAAPILAGGQKQIAMTENSFGKGKAFLSSLAVGELYSGLSKEAKPAFAKLILDVLARGGVNPFVQCYRKGVEAHLLEKDDKAYLVLINHNPTVQTVPVKLLCPVDKAWSQAVDVFTLESNKLDASGKRIIAQLSIPPNSVRIFALMAK